MPRQSKRVLLRESKSFRSSKHLDCDVPLSPERNLKRENWSAFHDRHHSASFHKSSDYLYKRGGCGAHICGENANWLVGLLGSVFSGGSKHQLFDDDNDSVGSGGLGRRKRKSRRGNIRIDAIRKD